MTQLQKDLLTYVGVILAGVVIGYFICKSTIKERTVYVTQTTSLDSLNEVILKTSVIYKQFDSVRNALNHLKAHPQKEIVTERDTVWQIVHEKDTVQIPIYTASLDTTIPVHSTIIQGEDTLRASSETKVNVGVAFYGAPFNTLSLTKLKMLPFTTQIPVKERVIVEGDGLHLHGVLGSWVTIGGMVTYSWLGLGYEYHAQENKQEIKTQFRLW